MGWRERRRRLRRARHEAEDRASMLAQYKRALQMTDEVIAREKRATAEHTDFEQGFAYLPPPALFAAVSTRPQIVELISDLERGVPLADVGKKAGAFAREVEAWDRRAREAGLSPALDPARGVMEKLEQAPQHEVAAGGYTVFWEPPCYSREEIEAELPDGTRVRAVLQLGGRRLGFDLLLPTGSQLYLRGHKAWKPV